MMKLHLTLPSPRALKVLALKNHLGLDCEVCFVDLVKGEQHRPEFAALNPNERMPVLEDDGYVLWESNRFCTTWLPSSPEAAYGLLTQSIRPRSYDGCRGRAPIGRQPAQ